jgi:hypothetical protein
MGECNRGVGAKTEVALCGYGTVGVQLQVRWGTALCLIHVVYRPGHSSPQLLPYCCLYSTPPDRGGAPHPPAVLRPGAP